jgi:hypothetical protein
MFPPKVEDRVVLEVIRQLSAAGKVPSGAAVRAALARQYGCRGGVARIYRLLAAEQARQGATPRSAIEMGLLEQENYNLRDLLKQLRQREDAHQVHWSRQIGELLERVRHLESQIREGRAPAEISDALKKDVQAAETRAEQLELQVRVFGPAAERSRGG